MKLTSVRIQNYKCVEDSGAFSVADLTCLAGKNESGKTALLQALRRLNPVEGTNEANFDDLDEFPRRRFRGDVSDEPVLTTVWELSDDEVRGLEGELGRGILSNRTVVVRKGYGNDLVWDVQWAENDFVRRIRSDADEGAESQQDIEQLITDALEGLLPMFLYFPTYGILPGEISVDEVVSVGPSTTGDWDRRRHFRALLDLAGTDAQTLRGARRREELIARLESVSNNLGDVIFKYWSQNKDLRVQFRYDPARPDDDPDVRGDVFQLRIENARHRVSTEFDARSSGFVWFFSFLVWFNSVSQDIGDNLIILLDEPGLSLHGTAQSDLLSYIKSELLPNHQVIYTTHSPFMVDADNLLGVRTVEDMTAPDGSTLGTKVGDEVLSSDAETLFPLRAAMGYSITQSLFIGEHSLLVEGPSDFVFLRWASNRLEALGRTSLDRRWTITPGGGITKLGTFVALFAGQHLDVAVFTDLHQGDKSAVRKLRDNELLGANRVFTADQFAGQPEADTEDMIGWELYSRVVNRCYDLAPEMALPAVKPPVPSGRVLEAVEDHFRTVAVSAPEFDHLTPANYLLERQDDFATGLGIDAALDRFESLFETLNALL